MGKYTVRGSKELDARIDDDLDRIRKAAAPYCEAGILLGGYGRGEGTPFITADGSQEPFNDYDMIVIVAAVTPVLKAQFQRLEQELTEEVGLRVDLYPYVRRKLASCEFSLLNYEMKYNHMVIWGDPHILDAMPRYRHQTIPLSEGSRLLMNRGKLLLDIKRRLATAKPFTEEERVRYIKFISKVLLAFGDCALLAAGRYDISYEVKKNRIPMIGHPPNRDFIIAGYMCAIDLKEWGDYHALQELDIDAQVKKTIEVFCRFLPWYRKQYDLRECSIAKAVALNLKWNRRLSTRHPREALYDALIDLLQDQSALSHERFYELQRRFS